MPEHYFRTIRDRRSGTKKPIIEFQDEQYDLAASFLMTEADRHHREILKVLEEVLAGDRSEGRFRGTQYRLAVFPAFTIVYDEEDEHLPWCQIDTEDLYDLVLEWLA